jgi:hypothetical protein
VHIDLLFPSIMGATANRFPPAAGAAAVVFITPDYGLARMGLQAQLEKG